MLFQVNLPKQTMESRSDEKSPFKDGYTLFILLIVLMMGLAFSQVFSAWTLYLKHIYGFMEYHIGLFMALKTLLVPVVEMPIIHKVERFDPLKTITVGTVLLFLGFAIMPLASGIYFTAFTVILWTIGEMLVFPITVSFIANRAPESVRGKYMGLFSLTFALSFVMGPLAGTWIYDNLQPDYVWYLTGALGLFAVVGLLLAKRVNKKL